MHTQGVMDKGFRPKHSDKKLSSNNSGNESDSSRSSYSGTTNSESSKEYTVNGQETASEG